MANELDYEQGLPVTLQLTITDVGAGATPVDGVLMGANGAAGFRVPTGYNFHALFLDVEYNAARTAGTSTVRVTDDGTEIANGPEALIDGTNTVTHQGVSNVGASPIPAGSEVGVSATGSGTFAPTTADADVLLVGVLLPA